MAKHDPNKTINLGKRPGPSEPQHRPDGVPQKVWESQWGLTNLKDTKVDLRNDPHEQALHATYDAACG